MNDLSFVAIVSMVMHCHKPEWHATTKQNEKEKGKIFAIIKVKITLWAGIIIISF